MNVQWDHHDIAQWDEDHARVGGALQQDWAYGACMQLIGVPVWRARVSREGEPMALAQFIGRRLGPLATFALCSRGPVWLQDLSAADKAQAYRALRQSMPLSRPRFAFFSPDEPLQSELGLPSWRRVITGYATVMLDLTPSLEELRAKLEGRWRNRLVAAESSDLVVHKVGTNPAQYRWVLEQENQQREQRGFQGLPVAFMDHYIQSRKAPARTVLTLRADLGRERVAAMLFLLHGSVATYQVGWSDDTGRDLNAHNLLLWHAIEALKQRGIRQLDLGGVNTARSAGIARFKLGTGGQPLILAGTYL
jgi:hypothetical protein